MHSFSGSSEILKSLLKLNIPIYFSFSMKAFPPNYFLEIISSNDSEKIKKLQSIKKLKSLISCPLENLLLETDSPYQINQGVGELLKEDSLYTSCKEDQISEAQSNYLETVGYNMDPYVLQKMNRSNFTISNYFEKQIEAHCCEESIHILNLPLYLNIHYFFSARVKNVPIEKLINQVKKNFLRFCK